MDSEINLHHRCDESLLYGESKILVVEDDQFGRAMIVGVLQRQGFVHIIEAGDGQQAFDLAKEHEPDLIIMDIEMPVINGYECTRLIRKHPKISLTPILVQTGLSASDDKVEAFESGADDFLVKPIDARELILRVTVHLEREWMYKNIRDFGARLQDELNMARKTQQVLLPTEKQIGDCAQSYGVHINQLVKTSSEVGGDFWGIKVLSDTKFAVYLVDFSGHGVYAALNTFRLHTIIHQESDLHENPSAYMAHLNNTMCELLPCGQFATMFYGVIDCDKGVLEFSTAACPPPLMFNCVTGDVERLLGDGFPLGAQSGVGYDQRVVDFGSKHMLLLYSDALIETPDEKSEFISINDLIEKMKEYIAGAEDEPAKIFDKFLNFFNDNYAPRLKDDLTVNTYYRA